MPPSTRIVRGALVCDGAVLAGDITIGATTVVFPGAKIQCLEGAGPVTMGNGCVVEEGASIVNMNPDEMHIGDGNLFEVGCTVHAKKVGFGGLGRAAGGIARIHRCSQFPVPELTGSEVKHFREQIIWYLVYLQYFFYSSHFTFTFQPTR